MKLSKEVAIQTIRGLLTGPRTVISYTQESAQLAQNQWRHNYRFFIINPRWIYNISGLITALFNTRVTDRSLTFSISASNAEQDRENFIRFLRQSLNLPDLILEDLIANAKETLEFVISPQAIQFLPMASHPPEIELSSGRPEPVILPEESNE